MRDVTKRVTFAVQILMCFVVALRANDNSGVCPSIDIRNHVSQFDKLINCTLIEGSVQIVLLDKTVENDFANLTFPNLREITQYLLVYRVKGLKSLAHLFPNLAIIRGTVLFANAALAIYHTSLQEIGLRSLTHILEGSVIIHYNYNLCFTDTINWSLMMKSDNDNKTYYNVVIGKNKELKECDSQEICKSSGCEKNLCWSKSRCQRLRLEGCHPLCAGGCYKPNSPKDCYACSGVLNPDGTCVSSCEPQRYEYLKRTCINETECVNKTNLDKGESYFTFNGICTNECPSMYQKNSLNTTCISCDKTNCYKECTPTENDDTPGMRTFKINEISEAKLLKYCTHINGSLVIEGIIGTYNSGFERVLAENLGMIEVIAGQLKIIHSHGLVSLNFLSKLHTIRGQHVNSTSFHSSGAEEQTKHTLTVKDNINLTQLWDWDKRTDKKFTIQQGTVFFHYNPKLCMSEIEKLVQVAKLPPFSNLEVSRESNGHGTMCSSVPFNVTVEKRNSNSAILALHISSNKSSDLAISLGRFMVFYKESDEIPLNDSSRYESLLECGDTQWRKTNDIHPNAVNGTYYMFLPHLEPAVQYIYFVRTMYSTIITSPLQTFTTLPAQPTVPRDLKVNDTTDSLVVLSWIPPYHSHGKLKYYNIKGYWQTDKNEDLLNRDYCKWKNEPQPTKPYIVTTTAAPVDDSNCKCNKNVTEKNNAQVCNAFEHRTTPLPGKIEMEMEKCDAFIYHFINTNYLVLNSLNQDESKVFHDSYDEESPSNNETYVFLNKTGEDGKYDSFQLSVDASANNVTIDNLRQYSEYVVMISACPEPHPEMPVPCSREAIITFRTKPSPNADVIDKSKVHVYTYNQTTNITWKEPKFANSFVHSYLFEYRNKEIENSKYSEMCVTSKQFHNFNDTLVIKNLPVGHYEFHLKAISLAGEGPTITESFHIEEQSQDYMSIIISSIVVVIIICVILVGFLYYWKSQINKNSVLIASVNPRYQPVYTADDWEVPRENVTILEETMGHGTFGFVKQAILQPGDVKCAVKTMNTGCPEDNMVFLQEATVMKEFKGAHHIVKLMGVVSKGLPVYVLMELMELGDLKSFLNHYNERYGEKCGPLSDMVKLRMAAQIADGMTYLEAKKFVHRDLAARNCMVAADWTIKIGDFGLARDIYTTEYYHKKDKGALPIRWMSPESIRDGIFTSFSDMWSYGVVMWEITTYGALPFHNKNNEEVIRHVQACGSLDIPETMHPVLKPLTKCCWKRHPTQRPKFIQVMKLLDEYLDDNFCQVSFYHNGEDPKRSGNIVPCKTCNEPPYIYNKDNDEVSLCLSSPSTSGTISTARYKRNLWNLANGNVQVKR